MRALLTHWSRLAPPPLLAIGAALFFAGVAFRPLGDVDIYWQLRLGDVILDAGTPYVTEPFLAHRAGVPHDPICWLSQVILALVRRAGDWRAVRGFDALLLTGGLLALLWPAALRVRDVTRGWVVLVAGGAGVVCLAPYTTVRPQSFTMFAWAVLLAVYFSNLRPGPKVLLAAGVCLFWQNCHPSITMAVGWLGAAAGVAWLRYLLKRRATAPWAESAVVFVAAVAQVATPAGLAIFRIAAVNRHMCTEVFPITEWFPITHPDNLPGSLHGLGVAAATVALVAWRRRRVHWEEVAPAAAVFACCFLASRFTLLLAPAVLPVWIRCLTPRGAETNAAALPTARFHWAFFLGLMTLAAAVPAVLRTPLHGPEPYRFPFPGIEELKKRHVTGTVYVFYFWGGVVTDLGYPQWTVSHDGRYYLHSDEAWRAYRDVDPPSFEAFHPVAAILDRSHDDGWIAYLRKHPDYDVIHEDDLAVTFVRK